MEFQMLSSKLDQLGAVLGALALAVLVVVLALLRADQLGYAGVQIALLVGAPAAFFIGAAIFGEAAGRLADRPTRRRARHGAARA
jgi:hypothetical protein